MNERGVVPDRPASGVEDNSQDGALQQAVARAERAEAQLERVKSETAVDEREGSGAGEAAAPGKRQQLK